MADTFKAPMNVGPGTLTFGSTGSQVEHSDYVKSATVAPNTSTGDPETVLSGRIYGGEFSTTWTLSVTAFQNVASGGLTDWAMKNAGKELPFEYRPEGKNSGAVMKGTVQVQPLSFGGDVGQRPTHDFEWPLVGTPTFTPAS